MSQSASQQAQSQYFDLHMSGIGYLSRVREVPTDDGTVLACSIAALRGKRDDAQYTYCDVYVVGQRAKDIVQMLEPDVQDDRKVLIGFKLGDPSTQAYEVKEGESAGEIRTVIKGRLLKITMAKVDQEFIDLPEDENHQQSRRQQEDRHQGNWNRGNGNGSRERQFSRAQGPRQDSSSRHADTEDAQEREFPRESRSNDRQYRSGNGSQGRQFSRGNSQNRSMARGGSEQRSNFRRSGAYR